MRTKTGRHDRFDAAAFAGRAVPGVILTRDELGQDGQPFRRLAYIATYGVKNVQVEGTSVAFQFVERLDDFT